jgi:hypothetical protein
MVIYRVKDTELMDDDEMRDYKWGSIDGDIK